MRFEDALLAGLCGAALLATLLLPLFDPGPGPGLNDEPRLACVAPAQAPPACAALPRPFDVR